MMVITKKQVAELDVIPLKIYLKKVVTYIREHIDADKLLHTDLDQYVSDKYRDAIRANILTERAIAVFILERLSAEIQNGSNHA